MRQGVLSIGTYAAGDPNGICEAQTPAAGGIQELLIDGAFEVGSTGIAALDTPRQVIITTADDETARTFVITGSVTKASGLVVGVVEALVGLDTAVSTTVQTFDTVTSVKVDGDTVDDIIVGTVTAVSTNWYPLDPGIADFNVGLNVVVGGATASLDVELTLTNLMSPGGNNPQPDIGSWRGSVFDRIYPTVFSTDHDTLTTVTADAHGNIQFGTKALRLVSNGAIVAGPVYLEVVQTGQGG